MASNENNEKLTFILKSSVELFRKFGIRSTSMEDIARELGMSKKTLYLYVDSKTDLLQKTFVSLQCDFGNYVEEIVSKNLNAIDELLEVSKVVNEEIKKLNPSNIFDLQKYYPDVYKEHIKTEKQFTYAMICNNLEKGKQQGYYREDQDNELIAELYIQKIQSMHNYDFLNQANFSMKTIFKVMFENHIRGISNPEGIAYFEQRKQQLKFE